MSTPSPKYFKAWLIFFLIATVGGMVIGAVLGGVMGFGMGLAQINLNTIKLVCGFAGFVIAIPISYFTYRWTVSEFIVKELTATPPAIPPVLPAKPDSPRT